jgi:hypothetical protein
MDTEPNIVLVSTSLFFITNSIVAYLTNQYIYAVISIGLFISSVIHHYIYSDLTNFFDKFFVYLFVCFGGYTLYQKISTTNIVKTVCIIVFFVFSIIVYNYGKMYNQFCFDPNIIVANIYHGLLHILSSFGHNLIILFDYY